MAENGVSIRKQNIRKIYSVTFGGIIKDGSLRDCLAVNIDLIGDEGFEYIVNCLSKIDRPFVLGVSCVNPSQKRLNQIKTVTTAKPQIEIFTSPTIVFSPEAQEKLKEK